MPKGDPESELQKLRRWRTAWNLRRQEKREAARQERETKARDFLRDVEPIISSRVRTRFFISLSEHGPLNMDDALLTIARSSLNARRVAIDFFVQLGIVANCVPNDSTFSVFYLNPGHPAYGELREFGKALARRWPSPPHPARPVVQTPVSLPVATPCNLFRREEGNRALLLVAVAGRITAMQIHREAGMMSTWDRVNGTLLHFEHLGILARDETPSGKGVGRGQPRKYFLNPNFFAFLELRELLWALAATTYEDIVGLARALARDDREIAEHVQRFDEATYGRDSVTKGLDTKPRRSRQLILPGFE